MGVLSMKGGDGEHSYANNSEGQVRIASTICMTNLNFATYEP